MFITIVYIKEFENCVSLSEKNKILDNLVTLTLLGWYPVR
jgi:hypothetical protein